jgi:hypothetical protein
MALFQIAAIRSNLELAGRVQDQVQLYNAVGDCSGSSIREQNFFSTRLSSTDSLSCLDRRITIKARRTQITSRHCGFSAAW